MKSADERELRGQLALKTRTIALLMDELTRLKEVVADVDAKSIDRVLRQAERAK